MRSPDAFTSFLLQPYSPLVILALLLLIAYFPLAFYLARRQDRSTFVNLLIQELIYVRTCIQDKEDSLTDKLVFWNFRGIILSDPFILFDWGFILLLLRFEIYPKVLSLITRKPIKISYYIWDSKAYSSKSDIIKDLTDYIKVDDFYRSLKERNNAPSDNERIRLNSKCYLLSLQALEIDWSKYK